MKIKVRKVRACSPVDGRRLKRFCWHWMIFRGREQVGGGYCATKRDALNDARLTAGDVS